MRRFWMLFCLVALLVVALAVPAMAAEEHTHCICGGTLAGKEGHSCANVTFTEVTTAENFTALVTAEGTGTVNICLGEDITISSNLSIAGKTVNLCLGEHTITMSNSGRLTANSSGKLNIAACADGAIVAASGNASGLLYTNGGSITLYGGNVDASGCKAGSGGAVSLNAAGDSFTMYGGELVGSKTATKGGAIYAGGSGNGASVNIHGGLIRDGYATSLGGNIDMVRGTLTITGGTITGGVAGGDTNGLGGGGICLEYNAKPMVLSGDAKIYGNQGVSTTTTTGGADIRLNGHATNNMIKVGDWEGNGDHPAIALLKLSPSANLKVISFNTGSDGKALAATPYGVKSSFVSVTQNYQLAMLDSTGVTLQAATDHIHCVCNGQSVGVGDHVCQDVLYTEMNEEQFKALFEANGSNFRLKADQAIYNVCLTSDVGLAAEYQLNGKTLNLCLHGQTINFTSNGRITSNGTTGLLTITDCAETEGQVLAASGCRNRILYTYKGRIEIFAGKIDATNATGTNTGAALFLGYKGDSATLYGGIIQGSTVGKITLGASVYVLADTTFDMYDGTIQGGVTATSGGNIHVIGTMNLHGGTVQGGSAPIGGNISVEATGSLYVTGGTIRNGTATTETVDGTVGGGNIHLLGTMHMSAGQVLGGSATFGGGVFVGDGGSLTLSGTGNFGGSEAATNGGTASYGGGNLCVGHGGNFEMTAGTLYGGVSNHSSGNFGGGNVCVLSGGTMSLSGTAMIDKGTCAKRFGGNVCILGQMNMSGGTIQNGSARYGGGNVMVSNDGAFNMSGGLITGGLSTETGFGNGVFVRSSAASFSLSGDAKIYGNRTTEGSLCDVCLPEAKNSENVYEIVKTIQLDGWKGNGTGKPKMLVDAQGTNGMFATFAEGKSDANVVNYIAPKANVSLIYDASGISFGTTGGFPLRNADGTTFYFSGLQDAVTAASENAVITLTDDVTGQVTIGKNVYLDLAGHSIEVVTVAGGKKLKLIDAATADYKVETDDEGNYTGFGVIENFSGDYEATFNTPSATYGKNYKYLVLSDDMGLHAHRIYLAVKSTVIYPRNTAMKYQTVFYCDAVVAGAVADYGIELAAENTKSASFGAPAAYIGGNNNSKLTLLARVLNTDMLLEDQNYRMDTAIEACAYITLKGQEEPVLKSAKKSLSFRQAVNTVLTTDMNLSAAQKQEMVKLHDRYQVIQETCGCVGGNTSSALLHEWKENTLCVCLGQAEGQPGHTCDPIYFEDVATAEQFVAYFNGSRQLKADANIRLAGDITLEAEYGTGTNTLNLWLNGHTITLTTAGRLTANGGGTLNITSESADQDGKIICSKVSGVYAYGGTLRIFGGTIDASGVTATSDAGGAIRLNYNTTLEKGSVCYVYGGTVIGAAQVKDGGLLYVDEKGAFYQYGGTLTGGKAAQGGSAYMEAGASLTLAGGTITGGEAARGGNILANGANASVVITGGNLTDGVSNSDDDAYGGGNIFVMGGAKAEISGGIVSGGKTTGAAADGGNINVNNGTLTLTGGTVTGGQMQGATGYGDGIYLGWNGNLNLSGNAQIYGNNGQDIVLSGNEKKVVVLGAWSGNANGQKLLLSRAVDAVTTPVVTVSGVAEADRPALLEKLGSAKEGYGLQIDGNNITLAQIHEHCVCGATHSAIGDHEAETSVTYTRISTKEEFESFFDSNKTLIADANILLCGDITLTAEYKLGGNTLNLCLGGKTLTMSGSGRITANGGTGLLNLTDCKTTGKILAAEGCTYGILYTYGGRINLFAGVVDGTNVASANYGTVRLGQAEDAIYVYGGTIYGSQKAKYGGSIGMNVAARVCVYGGTITGGKASSRGGNIGVYDAAGTVEIHGGTISGGHAALGGNIALHKGSLVITSGIITGGSAAGDSNGLGGGAIAMEFNATSLQLSGDAQIYGNTGISAEETTGGADIRLNGGDHNVITLGAWSGNAEGTAVIYKVSAAAGIYVAKFASGENAPADPYGLKSNFAYVDTYQIAMTDTNGFTLQDGHVHCPCQGQLTGTEGHSCLDVVYEAVATAEDFAALYKSDRSVLNENKSIYLAGSFALDKEYKLGGKNLNICLDEQTLTMKSSGGRLTANASGTMTICAHENGQVKVDRVSGLYMYGGNVTLYSGTVDASSVESTSNGGAVYVRANAGGTVRGTMTMYGGQILGGTANRGGAVYVTGGDFTLCGGTITGGKAELGGNVAAARLTISGATYDGLFAMHGGALTDGEAALGGGNLFLTGSDAVITGGSVTGGVSTADGTDLENHFGGGNICVGFESDLTLTGGTITDGVCAMGREDISVQPNSFVTNLSGAPTVGNLYLVGKSLTIDMPMSGGSVGVVLHSSAGEVASGAGAAASAAYLSSRSEHAVMVDGNRLVIDPECDYSVGYGKADITPETKDVNLGLKLQGFSNENHVTKANTPVETLWATAMAVTDAKGDTVLLISVDNCSVNNATANKVRLNVSRVTGIPVENISIAAAHQHSTPYIATTYYKDAEGNYTDADGNPVDEANKVVKTDYAATFHAGVMEAVQAALEARMPVSNMETATVETKGKGENGASFNYVRNIVITDKKNGTVIGTQTDNHKDVKAETWKGYFTDYNAGYESNVDHTMQLVKITLSNGKSVILANFQTHPHLGADPNTPMVHADIVGAFRDKLSQLSGAEVIYFSGASGDVNPRDAHMDGKSYAKDTLQEYKTYGADLATLAYGASYAQVNTGCGAWDVAVSATTVRLDIRDDLKNLTEDQKTDLLTRATGIASGEVGYIWEDNVSAYTDKALRLYSVYHVDALLSRTEVLAAGTTYYDVGISAFSLGPVAVVNAPYEMFQLSGQQIKGISVASNGAVTRQDREDGFEMILVASKSNGAEGYIPTADGYANGGYSTDVAWYVAGSAETLVSHYQQLLKQLSPKAQ